MWRVKNSISNPGRPMIQKRALALAGLFVLLSIERSLGQQYPAAPQFFPAQTQTAEGLPQLARSLAAEAQNTADNVRYELTGTYTGGQAEMRANALAQATAAFQQAVNFRRGPELLQSFTAVDRAYASLAGVLGNRAGMAPRTTNAMVRVQRLSFQIRNVIGSYSPGAPGLPLNCGPSFNARGLADATSNLQIAAEQASQVLAFESGRGSSRGAGFLPEPRRSESFLSRNAKLDCTPRRTLADVPAASTDCLGHVRTADCASRSI